MLSLYQWLVAKITLKVVVVTSSVVVDETTFKVAVIIFSVAKKFFCF